MATDADKNEATDLGELMALQISNDNRLYLETGQAARRESLQCQLLEIVISIQGSRLNAKLRPRWLHVFDTLLRQYVNAGRGTP